jgi:hypothetical protein
VKEQPEDVTAASVKEGLAQVVPENADWVIVLYPETDGPMYCRLGIAVASAIPLLRNLAAQLEREMVPDPDSNVKH